MKPRLFFLVAWCSGCLPFGGPPPKSAELTAAARDLVQIARDHASAIDWLGLRDGQGEQTDATRVLDDYLISALVQSGVELAAADTTGKKWRDGAVVALQAGGSADLVLGGRLQEDAGWMYVRLFLAERAGGRLVAARPRR